MEITSLLHIYIYIALSLGKHETKKTHFRPHNKQYTALIKSTWEESIYRGFKKEKKRKAKSQGNDLKICHLSFSALEIVYNISHTKSSNSGRVKLQKALSAADYIVSISTERLLARLYRVASLRGRSYNRSIFFISLLFLFHAR